MTDPAGFGRAGEVGLEPGMGVYLVGRFGVLGRVDADVVVAAAVFWNPETIRITWDAAMETSDPREVAGWYGGLCADYGRAHFAGAPGLDRWCDLAGRVVDTAPVAGVPTFAGWRAVGLPDDAPGRAYQLSHVLRELRFGLHANATVAAGLDPLVAMLAGPGTGSMVPMFGWQEPYPEPTEADVELRKEVEVATNELSAASLSVLTEDEVEEMIGLAEGMVAAAV